MAEALIHIGIDLPRRPLKVPGVGQLNPGDWQVAGESVIGRVVETALKLADPENIRLVTGDPDEGIYRLVEQHGVPEVDLGMWLENTARAAREASEDALVIILRPEVVLRNYRSLVKAIEGCRANARIERVEPAFRPQRHTLDSCVLSTGSKLVPLADWLGTDRATLGRLAFPCPAFEVIKLRQFRYDTLSSPVGLPSGFVWIDEGDAVLLDRPIDFLRAEAMLKADA